MCVSLSPSHTHTHTIPLFFPQLWHLRVKDNEVRLDFVKDLCGHQTPVNCVRFSGGGELLASAGTEGDVVVWKRQDDGDWRQNHLLKCVLFFKGGKREGI